MVGIGLALALIGSLFVFLMLRSFLRAKEILAWPEVPCVILSSTIEERRHDPHSPIERRLAVTFGYEWQGENRTSERFSLRGSPWTSKPRIAEERAEMFPVGSRTTCRVDPSNPDFALLVPDSLAPGYSIWFPALFVVGGLGIVIRQILPSKKHVRA